MAKYNKNYKPKSAEERKKEIDDAMQLIEQGVIDFLTSDKYISFLKSMSKFHNYSFNNTILILSQCPTATHVASFPAWKRDFNRYVTSGSKGIKILVPVEYKIYKNKVDPETNEVLLDKDGEPIKEYSGEKGLAYKIGNVFDVQQTQQIEGKEVIPLDLEVKELTDSVNDYSNLLNAIINTAPVPVVFGECPRGAKGYFSPVENKIVIQDGLSELHTLKTAIHETAHAILHNTENLKKLKSENIELNSSDKETQAESVAFIVSYHYGLDTSDYSFPYVATWAGEVTRISANMKYISEAASQIIDTMDKQLELVLDKDEQIEEISGDEIEI